MGHPYLWWENPWISRSFSRNRQRPEAIAGMPLATYILASFAADVVGMPGERCFRIPERLIVLRFYKSIRSYTAVTEDTTSGFFNFCWFTGSLYPSLAWVNHDGMVIEQSLLRECPKGVKRNAKKFHSREMWFSPGLCSIYFGTPWSTAASAVAAGAGHGSSIVAVGLCVFLPVRKLSCCWTMGARPNWLLVVGCYGEGFLSGLLCHTQSFTWGWVKTYCYQFEWDGDLFTSYWFTRYQGFDP